MKKIVYFLAMAALLAIKFAVSMIAGYIIYFIIGFLLDKLSGILDGGLPKNTIENVLSFMGPFGFGIPMVFILGLVIFVLWVHKTRRLGNP